MVISWEGVLGGRDSVEPPACLEPTNQTRQEPRTPGLVHAGASYFTGFLTDRGIDENEVCEGEVVGVGEQVAVIVGVGWLIGNLILSSRVLRGMAVSGYLLEGHPGRASWEGETLSSRLLGSILGGRDSVEPPADNSSW